MDQGHEETDALLQEMEQKIRKQYAQAAKELTEKLEKHLKQFEEKDKMMLSRLDAGEITDAEYFRWRTGQIMTGKRWEQMRDQLAADLVHSHQLADSVVNGYLPEVYALNHNYGTYQIEHDLQMSTSYTLYNRQAVERLLRDDPDMLPQPRVDIPKAERWNRQHIQSAVLQGILQGESMDKIARRMRDVCGMDARAAIRNARTATTGAENAGRLDSMNRALGLGVQLKKLWLATRDSRTRDSHVLLDGELREVNEKFSNGCMHPGDPHGAPAEVYNCRCAMRSKVAGADPYSPDLSRNQRLGGMSYEQWKQAARERVNSKSGRGYDNEKPKIVFDGKFNDEKWSETKRVINKLANEYNTRMGVVTGGAKKAAGEVDISGYTMRLNSSYIDTAIHEFAHTLAGTDADKVGLTNDAEFWKEIKKIKRAYRKAVADDSSRWISSYEHGSNSLDEFMAEAFTLAKMKEMGYEIPDKYGKDLTYANQVLDVVNKYFGKKSL